jgi:ATP-dependent helicase/nuclease subunit A
LNPRPAPTSQQQKAIAAQGNVLVVAGAGAGKTRTLVERCLAWLVADGGSVDEMLMVTFTQAAAAEMRQRLRAGLESAGLPPSRLAEQLALLDTSHICTLHSFCFNLLSEHFYELGLDPQLKVFSEEEARVLARQTLDAVLDEIYQSHEPAAQEIQRFILAHGADGDRPLRDLIDKVHRYAQTLRDADGWLAAQVARFQSPAPDEWRAWLMDELNVWPCSWRPVLRRQPAENTNAASCLAILDRMPAHPSRTEWSVALGEIAAVDLSWPKPKTKWRKPLDDFFAEAEFLLSVCAAQRTDPLAEDWEWVRPSMLALLGAVARFARAFDQAKRKAGGIDYHDLEQFALRLLWKDGQPSRIARHCRQKLRLVFVDEFQDINGAEEGIIEAVARSGAEANRFLVGDVKQSIYRFRLADPGIFVRYKTQWEVENGASVFGLSENFRSHEGILDFVNSVFASLMRAEIGGVDYDAASHLHFGAREQRGALAANPRLPPPVELHLRCRGLGENEQENGETEAGDNASDTEKEARLIGRRLLALRPEANWGDMVILLRSPRNKVEAYVKEFTRLGIPLAAARGGFYDALEISDLLSMLQLLDNPLQDLPLLAVLRSPLVGLTSSELALIRAACPQGRFWSALVDWHRQNPAAGPREKAGRFLDRFRAWRRQARQSAVSHCLERIIDETRYSDWLLARERGAQRQANVERLLQLARQFDSSRGESLPRFLAFVAAQQESEGEIEPAAAPEGEAVRLMSIHQSKGLEFPVVVVADLGKRFNLSDLGARIILDSQFGFCPQVRPPDTPQLYPSLPYWLAQRRQKREMLGEEMRLLYVAMTRAARRLILCGTVAQKSLEEKWPARTALGLGSAEILSAAHYLDWLGPWLVKQGGSLTGSGADALLSWTLYDENHPALAKPAEDTAAASVAARDSDDITAEVRDRLAWHYSFQAETQRPAKSSVSVLRRQMAGEEEGEAARFFAFDTPPFPGRLSAGESGSAHHTFLERVALEKTASVESLREEAARLCREKILTAEQLSALDFDALAAFWQSEVGRLLLANAGSIRRELAFTARFPAADLARLGSQEFESVGAGEFVIVQGAIDLGVFLPEEIWLVDFKTDRFPAGEVAEKIRLYTPQLSLYAEAISRIHQRPVTRRWLHFLAARMTVGV